MTKNTELYGKIKVDDIRLIDDNLMISTQSEVTGDILLVGGSKTIDIKSQKIKNGWSINTNDLKYVNAGIDDVFRFSVKHEYLKETIISDIVLRYGSRKPVLSDNVYIGNSLLKYSRSKNYHLDSRAIKKTIFVRDYSINEGSISFKIDNEDSIKYTRLDINFVNIKLNKLLYSIEGKIKGNLVSFALTDDALQAMPLNNMAIELSLSTDNDLYESDLYFDNKVDHEVYYTNTGPKMSAYLYVSKIGKLMINKNRTYNVFRQKIGCNLKIKSLRKKRNKGYKFSIAVTSPEPIKIKNVVLGSRNNDNEIQVDNIKIKPKKNNSYKVYGDANIEIASINGLYWDLLLDVEDSSGNEDYVRVNNATRRLKAKIHLDYFSNSIRTDNLIFYPYLTLARDISFAFRDKEYYEINANRIKMVIAYVVYLLLKKAYFNKKNIWLGFEKLSQTAQDNGYAFFKYVDSNKLHPNFYYIIDPNTEVYKEIKNTSNNIVKLMSFKYMLLVYASKLLVGSETKRHAYNLRIRSDLIATSLYKKKSIFLQHGVTALKQSDVFKKSRGRGNFDLVIATSDKEKEIIEQNWLYEPEEIAVTGFSRWDHLTDESDKMDKPKIFVMPTWRTWIEGLSPSEFKETDYYKNYTAFLHSKKLDNILEKNGVELVFFLHPKFKSYSSNFSSISDNIIIKEAAKINVQQEVKEASLLISDYSSVTWDMFYINKPVIFFQFDHKAYDLYEGSYINMEKDLFGERVEDVDSLISSVNKCIGDKFEMNNKYSKMRKEYFKYIDHNNSKRILEEINKVV